MVDYAGVGKELAEALVMFDKEDLEGIFGADDMKKELANLAYWHKVCVKFFDKINRSCVKPEDVLQKCMDILLPDPVVNPYVEDFKFLGAVREGARNLYRDERLSLEVCSKKVEDLIHSHIVDAGIEQLLEPINITAPDFEEKLDIKGSKRAKASHVEYAIKETIAERIAEDPAFYGSLKEQLESLIAEDRKERKSDAEYLKRLLELRDQEARKEAHARSLGLDNAKELALYGIFTPLRKILFSGSEKEQVAFTKEIIRVIKDKRVIDWTEKEDIKREMRSLIRRKLKAKKCPKNEIEPMVYGIMNIATIQMKDP